MTNSININALILDAIVLIIVLIFAVLSAKKGFVRTLIEVVGFIAALTIAISFSTPSANLVYDKVIAPGVIETVEDVTDTAETNVTSAVDSVWDKMPKFLTQNNFLGLSKEEITNSVFEITGNNVEQGLPSQSEESINDSTVQSTYSVLANTISETVVKPPVTKLLSVLFSVIFVVVLLFIVKILAKYINKLFTFSVIGSINKTLGAVIGIVKGLVFAIVFCLFISLILSFTKNGFLIFTYDAINSSYIFKFLMEFSPFI